jgi:AcrR family transcriptional regulator
MGQADKKDEILDAATRCFARYGYEKTTMDDIGKLVGMNKVSLYYYFDGKEALFKAALGRESRQFDERCLAEARAAEGFRARIETWIARSFRYSQESGLLRSVTAEGLSALRPVLREFRGRALETGSTALSSFIEEGIVTGEARSCDARKTGQAIFGIAFSMKQAAFQDGGEVDIDELIGRILFAVGLVLDGIAAGPAAKPRAGKPRAAKAPIPKKRKSKGG